MGTTTDQVTSRETGSTLQLKRPLLPIDEYAAREGVSRDIVEECGQLGIVQIRKYKGKTFVVDVPLSPYRCASEAPEQPTQPADKTAHAHTKKTSELVQKLNPDAPETAEEPGKSNNETVKAGMISALVKKMSLNTSKITDRPAEKNDDETGQPENIPDYAQIIYPETPESTEQSAELSEKSKQVESKPESAQMAHPEPLETIDEPTAAVDEIRQIESLLESIQTPVLQTLDITDELPELVDEDVVAKETPELAQITQNDGLRSGILTAQARSKRTWQAVAVFSLACLLLAIFANLWFYMNRQTQLDRLDRAYANIQKGYDDSIQADQKIGTLQSELANSRAEVETVRNELTRARQELETVQQRNIEAVARLNEQIQKLRAPLTERTKSPQTPSSSGIAGK